MKCNKAPNGWTCTRDKNHDGSCAAVQNTPTNTLRDEVLEILRYPHNKKPERFTIATQIRYYQADQLVELLSEAVNKARQHELNRLVIDKELDLGWYLRFDGAECNPQESGEENVANAVMDYVEARIKELETSNQKEDCKWCKQGWTPCDKCRHTDPCSHYVRGHYKSIVFEQDEVAPTNSLETPNQEEGEDK